MLKVVSWELKKVIKLKISQKNILNNIKNKNDFKLGDSMELQIENSNNSKYYDEALYIASNYNKFIKNPRKKAIGITRYAFILTGVSLIFLAIFTALTFTQHSNLYFYVAILFAVAFVMGIIYYLLIKNRISKLRTNNDTKKLIIENEYIELIVGKQRFHMEKSDIQHVLINKYSLCFLPRLKTDIIAIDVKYKNQVLESLNEKSLVVDNSDLY